MACEALVDTGAWPSFIDVSIVRQLGLPLVDVAKVVAVVGDGSAGLYLANMQIRQLGIRRNSPMGCLDFVALGWSFKAIVGRDFLSDLNLCYKGPSGRVTLEIP